MAARVHETTLEAANERQTRWKEWVHQALDGGASKAHKYVKEPEAWVPDEVVTPQGIISAAPKDLLDYQVKFWINIWTEGGKLKKFEWPKEQECNEEMRPITAEDVRSASSHFSTRTSGSPDGWHPRHYSLLGVKSREELAKILNMIENKGELPSQAEVILTVLLAKPQGGFRPIAILPSIYRLWMKSRRPYCEQWERDWHRPFFAMVEGQEP